MSKYSRIFNPSYGERLATAKQLEYMEILRNDCGFNLAQFKDYLNARYSEREACKLTNRQASLVIDDLKCRKKQEKLPLEGEDEIDF